MQNSLEDISLDPWVDKYRPKVLTDIVGNDIIINQLKEIAKNGNLPNMILSGPPGTGKTTTVLALARELLGDQFKIAVIELNASDERGIDTVRDKIKSFASQKIPLPEGRHKIIILDEADSMTETAQQALRVIISDSSQTTRFVFACNDSEKLIAPIQSRCIILRYSKLETKDIKKNILRVIQEEKLLYDEEGLTSLISTSEGDMRYALNNLQSTVFGFGILNKDNLYKIIDIPRPEKLVNIFELVQSKKLDEIIILLNDLLSEGYSLLDILHVFNRIILSDIKIEDDNKIKIMREISKYKSQLLDGFDKKIYAYTFFANLINI